MIYFSLIIRPFFRSVKDPAKAKLVPLKLSLFGPFVRKLIVLPAVFTCPRHFEFEFPGIIDEKAPVPFSSVTIFGSRLNGFS